jgi:uncharacterized protein
MGEKLRASAARALAVEASGIGATIPDGLHGTIAALRRLGSVQIDTISVVERAHNHILWTRNPEYRAEHIPALEDEPRRAIEYWSHAAAYLPIEEYRYCLPRMQRIRAQGHEWFRADPKAIAFVREKIAAEGPMRAQDFGESMKGKKGWWDWKPAKIALEYLFHAGELVSIHRRGFQKVYDLAERAVPSSRDLQMPGDDEMAVRYIDQAVSSLGIFTAGEIAYMRKDGLDGIDTELARRVEDGRLLEVGVIDAPAMRKPYYATPETMERASANARERKPRVLVLSPFDPLIIDRKRTMRIFGREYQLECYLPQAKRVFGYFALPLLYLGLDGDATLVGLLDAKAERGKSALLVRRLSVDPTASHGGRARGYASFARLVADGLREFAAFNRAERIDLQGLEASDGRLERSLRAAVARSA